MRMFSRCPALFLLLALASQIRGGEKSAEAPAVVLRVKSLDALLQNLNLVVRLVGQEDAAHQIEAVIKSKIGKKGIEGIDPTRPLGAYVRYGKEIDDITGAVLIPIADKETFLALLDNLGVKVKKDQNDIYTHKTTKNVDVYFRFANNYLYLTGLNAESIKGKNLPDPAKALTIPGDATFSILARVDQIPEAARTIALIKLQEGIDAAKKDGLPGESKAQKEFRLALLDDINKITQNVINQSAEVRFDLDVSEKTKELAVNVAVNARPGTDLAKSIKALGSLKSPLTGLVTKNLAFHGAFHVTLPDALHKAFEVVLDEAAAESVKGIQDATKKKQAELLFRTIMPTAKAGEYHVVGAVIGPKDDRYTFLGAVKLNDGVKLGAAVHQLISVALKQIPKDEQNKIQLDADKAGGVSIHRFEVPMNPLLDALVEDIAGDRNLYLAFREDAVFLALGKESLTTLKTVLARTGAADSPPLVFDVDVARMAKWLARTPKQKEFADKLVTDGGKSRVRLGIEGGESLRFNARLHFSALEFLLKLSNEKEK